MHTFFFAMLVQKWQAKNKQTISKLEKQQTKERKQNTKIYQTWKNNDAYKKKRLLDKLGNVLQFYVEIVIFIRNQVC
jgi:hypothetical protein